MRFILISMQAQSTPTFSMQKVLGILQQAAYSPEQRIREEALKVLQKWQVDQFENLLICLLQLLKSREMNTHFLSYSYILNELTLKNRRMNYNIVQGLENTYQELIGITNFSSKEPQKQLQNIILLVCKQYSKSTAFRERNDFLKQKVLSLTSTNWSLKKYAQSVLAQLIFNLPAEERRRHIQVNSVLSNLIFELLYKENIEDFENSLHLSYFLTLFPEKLWNSFTRVLAEPNIPGYLKNKTLNRIAMALNIDNHRPNFESCFGIYQTVKELAFSIVHPQNMEDILNILTGILKQTLSEICKIDHIETSQAMIMENIFSQHEYQKMITWLMSISQTSEFEEDQHKFLNNNILKIFNLMNTFISPQEQMNNINFFTQNLGNQEKILFFLGGATKEILQVFNSSDVLRKIIMNPEATIKCKYVYYHFLENYIRKYFIIEEDLFLALQKYIIFMVQEYEKVLNTPNSQAPESEMKKIIERIVHLLCIYIQMSKYPRQSMKTAITVEKYSDWITSAVYKYLVTARNHLSDVYIEKLFDAFDDLVSKYGIEQRRVDRNIICLNTIDMYSQFLAIENVIGEKTLRVVSKTRQELLLIIRKTINVQFVMSQEQNHQKFKKILVKFNPEDKTIARQILFLLKQFMLIFNIVVKVNTQVNFEQNRFVVDNVMNFINFDIIYVIEDIFFSEKLQQFQRLLSSNLSYDFMGNIDTLIDEFENALKVVVELSPYSFCFNFVENLTLRLILYMEDSLKTITNLCQIARKRVVVIKYSIDKLNRLPVYVDCLVETLYLNPRWINSQYMTETKLQILKTATFRKCKERIDDYVSGDITRMLAQVSLQNEKKQTEIKRWDQVYFDFLQGSGVGDFCQIWIQELKKNYD